MNSLPDCYYRTSIKALVLDSNKRFLLVKEATGIWELPGGGLEFGESPQQCLQREIKEEMGLEITSFNSRPCYFISFQNHKYSWMTNVLFEVTLNHLDFVPSEECIETKFFSKVEAVHEQLSDNVLVFINQFDPDHH